MNRTLIIKAVQEYVLDNFMTERQAQVYRLVAFKGYTYEQAGRKLGISKSNTRNHFERANDKMSCYMKLTSKILSFTD